MRDREAAAAATGTVGCGVSGKRWVVARVPAGERDRLAAALRSSPAIAAVLWNRGIRDAEEGARFLSPSLSALHDPGAFSQMDRAVDRIARAVAEKEHVAIYGDYDVDGLTAAALLAEFFDLVGAAADVYVPHRVDEGYGLNEGAVKALAARGVRLVITVDNGTGMARELELGRRLGMDFVVTDHHEGPEAETPAVATVNPKTEPAAPFRDLAGVGVAFKLAWAFARRLSRSKKVSVPLRAFLKRALGYVALGTVADVVPLRGENRVLVAHGLRELETWDRPGIRALREVACPDGGRLKASHIAFRLGPRINAAGRLGRADLALELLRTDRPERAREIARRLDRENRRRQQVERGIFEEARARVERDVDLARARSIVLADPGWHAGVIGIVAARLVEEFHRPAILVSLAGGRGKGSGRSVPRVHLRDTLARCREHLTGFGGHAQAAGIVIEEGRIEAFREAFERAISVPCEAMVGEIEVDAELRLDAVDRGLVAEIERLAPFGQGNRRPAFLVRDLQVVGELRCMGRSAEHLSFFVRQGDASLRAVAFGRGELAPALERARRCDMLFRPERNTWNGRERIELHVVDLRIG